MALSFKHYDFCVGRNKSSSQGSFDSNVNEIASDDLGLNVCIVEQPDGISCVWLELVLKTNQAENLNSLFKFIPIKVSELLIVWRYSFDAEGQ